MPGTSAPALATDHARDLDRLSAEIAELEQPPGPVHAEQATRLASCRVNRASLSGDVSEMRRAAAAVDAALARFGPWPDLCFVAGGRPPEAAPARRRGGQTGIGGGPRRLARRAGDPGRRRPSARSVCRGPPRVRAARRRDRLVGQPRAAGALRAGPRRPGTGRRALRRGRRRDHREGASLLRVGRDAPGPPAPAPRPARRGGGALRARGGGVLGLLARRQARRGPPGRAGPPRRGDRHCRGRRRAGRRGPSWRRQPATSCGGPGGPTRRGPGTAGPGRVPRVGQPR